MKGIKLAINMVLIGVAFVVMMLFFRAGYNIILGKSIFPLIPTNVDVNINIPQTTSQIEAQARVDSIAEAKEEEAKSIIKKKTDQETKKLKALQKKEQEKKKKEIKIIKKFLKHIYNGLSSRHVRGLLFYDNEINGNYYYSSSKEITIVDVSVTIFDEKIVLEYTYTDGTSEVDENGFFLYFHKKIAKVKININEVILNIWRDENRYNYGFLCENKNKCINSQYDERFNSSNFLLIYSGKEELNGDLLSSFMDDTKNMLHKTSIRNEKIKYSPFE